MVLAVSLLISWGFWYWSLHILAPANTAVVLAAHRPIGNNSDLYPRWLGARELLLHGRDPYSPEVTREIQIGFYGRLLNPQRASDPTDQESFVYPLYVAFLLAPTVKLPFGTVLVIFRWLLLGSIALIVPLWMYALRLRTSWLIVASGMVLATSTSPAVAEYFQQNLAALVVLFLAAAVAAIAAGQLALAGFLLALSTIKPQTSGFVILWLLLWAITGGRKRRSLAVSFLTTLGVLVLSAEIMSPHWIGHFVTAVRRYPAYASDPSLIQVLLPPLLAKLITAGLLLCFVVLIWRWRKAPPESGEFAWGLAWSTTVTVVVLPKLAAYNALLLIPALVIFLGRYQTLSQGRMLARTLIKAAFACQLWQWLSALLLSICSLLLPAWRIRTAAHVPEYTFFALWLMTMLAVAANTHAPLPGPKHVSEKE
jgi:hypothetical protein